MEEKRVEGIQGIGEIAQVERGQRLATRLVRDALEEVGRIVKLNRANGGWTAQIEPWEEIRRRRKRLRWCLLRLPDVPIVAYKIGVDKDFNITSCTGGEDANITETVVKKLDSLLERKVKSPLQQRKIEEELPQAELEYLEAKKEEPAQLELVKDALEEVGQVVKLNRANGGWAAQIEPWEEIRQRRKKLKKYPTRRFTFTPTIYDIELDKDLNITSCSGGEDPLATKELMAQLGSVMTQRIKEPIQKRKEEEEALKKQRVMSPELEQEYLKAKSREEWSRTASFLENDSLELILFGGKGGVGKTTSAAATALWLARLHPTKRLLVVSIDPAHSLGDSLNCSLSSQATKLEDVDNLWAMELDAQKLHDEFRKKHDEAMKKIATRGSIFDAEDIADIFSLALPGIDELMAIIEVANIQKSGSYDLIILDTAPTGHTLRLLALPDTILHWMHVFDLMQAKHRYLSRHLSGRYRKDDADAFIDLMVGDIRRVKSLLSNSRIAEFVPVTIPEPMSIYETGRLLTTLEGYNIPVKSIIVNQLAKEAGCPFCLSRRSDQEEHVSEIDQKFSAYNLFTMPLFPHEIRGVNALTEYAEILSGKAYKYTPAPIAPMPEPTPSPSAQMSELLAKDLRFILFSGKGGVGKTSAAAATALALAKRNPDKKVLAFCMDPAHSLADSFGYPIGDEVVAIKGINNLYGLELDPDKLWNEVKQDYKEDVTEIMDHFLGSTVGSNVQFEREVTTEFIEVTPPGLNEMMALDKLMDFYEEGAYDLYVVDTAATGHLIRFLELPEILEDWLQVLFKLLLKYRRVVRLADLPKAGWRLLRTSRHIRQVQAAFTDPKRTDFVAVTIPEAMGILETNDLLSALQRLRIPCWHIIMNMVIPPVECGFCSSKQNEQQRYLKQMENSKPPECVVTQVPLFPHQIKGIDDLTKLSEIMFGSRF